MDIDAIQERPRDPFAVARDRRRRTAARSLAVAIVAAGAGILRGNQREIRRERERAGRSANRYHAVFERLAEHLQRHRRKLRQFVQKQHAAMREGYFAWTWHAPAANQPR